MVIQWEMELCSLYTYGTFDSLNVEGTFDKLMVLLVMQSLNYMGFELCYGVSHSMGFNMVIVSIHVD